MVPFKIFAPAHFLVPARFPFYLLLGGGGWGDVWGASPPARPSLAPGGVGRAGVCARADKITGAHEIIVKIGPRDAEALHHGCATAHGHLNRAGQEVAFFAQELHRAGPQVSADDAIGVDIEGAADDEILTV